MNFIFSTRSLNWNHTSHTCMLKSWSTCTPHHQHSCMQFPIKATSMSHSQHPGVLDKLFPIRQTQNIHQCPTIHITVSNSNPIKTKADIYAIIKIFGSTFQSKSKRSLMFRHPHPCKHLCFAKNSNPHHSPTINIPVSNFHPAKIKILINVPPPTPLYLMQAIPNQVTPMPYPVCYQPFKVKRTSMALPCA